MVFQDVFDVLDTQSILLEEKHGFVDVGCYFVFLLAIVEVDFDVVETGLDVTVFFEDLG